MDAGPDTAAATLDRQPRHGDATAVQIEHPVGAIAIDDGVGGSITHDVDAVRHVEIAPCIEIVTHAQGRHVEAAVDGEIDRIGPRIRVSLADRPAQRPGEQAQHLIHRGVHRVGGQNTLPERLFPQAGGQRRLDAAGLVFEAPVATQRGGAGQVGAGGDVGAGKRRQVLHQTSAQRGLRKIAAVQQQVGADGQRRAPVGNFTGATQQRLPIERAVAKLQHAVAAVCNQVYGGDVVARGQRGADTRQPVLADRNRDHLDRPPGRALRLQIGQQGRRVGQRGIHKNDLTAPHLDAGGRRLHRLLRQHLGACTGQHQRRQVGRMQDAVLHGFGDQGEAARRHAPTGHAGGLCRRRLVNPHGIRAGRDPKA